MEKQTERESFKSRLGFLLVSAGCAIGMGNVWKFPWLAGQNGGGVFVLFYLIFLVLMGIPVMSFEFAVGRASRKSTVKGFRELEPKDSGWHVYGYFAVAGNYLLMMFYTSVAGWMINYAWKFLIGVFKSGMTADAVSAEFSGMLASPAQSLIFMVIAVGLGIATCAAGVQKGVEKITKFMMLGLFGLILVLVIHSFTLSGAAAGLKFYLVPDFQQAKAVGLTSIIASAMNQSFFTLSIGICSMEIFGTYMSKDNTLLSESIRITALDTFVAISAGLIIFPACFSYGVDVGAGPSLIFVTLPNVFNNMAGGRFWGILFFIFMTFAAMSTVIAVFENIIASFMDLLGWSRKKSVLVNLVGLLLLSIPVALEGNWLSGVMVIKGRGLAFLDSWDFLVSNLLLPLGSLIFTVFCCSKLGWGYDNLLAEANTGNGLKLGNSKGLKFYFRYILPVLILIILVLGI